MAGIFSPTLQQDVTPIRATEQPSAAASLFNLAGTVAEGLGAARDKATREAKANAPSYTERKDQFEKEQLNTYTTTLQEIQQMKDSGDISDTLYRQKIKALDDFFHIAMKYLIPIVIRQNHFKISLQIFVRCSGCWHS